MHRVRTFIAASRRTAERLRLSEAAVLVALLIIVLVVWGFIELADEVFEGDTQAFDMWMVRLFRDSQNPAALIGPHWLAESARDFTALGSVSVLALVIVVVAGFLALQHKIRAALLVIGAAVTGQLLSSTLKAAFGRERPTVVPHLTEVSSPSFPSGHAMMSAVVFLTLGALLIRFTPRRREKLYVISVALLLTVLIGVTRVFLGVHYPTDVLSGWAAGLAWSLLCWLAARYLQRRGVVEGEGEESMAR